MKLPVVVKSSYCRFTDKSSPQPDPEALPSQGLQRNYRSLSRILKKELGLSRQLEGEVQQLRASVENSERTNRILSETLQRKEAEVAGFMSKPTYQDELKESRKKLAGLQKIIRYRQFYKQFSTQEKLRLEQTERELDQQRISAEINRLSWLNTEGKLKKEIKYLRDATASLREQLRAEEARCDQLREELQLQRGALEEKDDAVAQQIRTNQDLRLEMEQERIRYQLQAGLLDKYEEEKKVQEAARIELELQLSQRVAQHKQLEQQFREIVAKSSQLLFEKESLKRQNEALSAEASSLKKRCREWMQFVGRDRSVKLEDDQLQVEEVESVIAQFKDLKLKGLAPAVVSQLQKQRLEDLQRKFINIEHMITQRLSSIEVEKELEKSKIVAGYKLQREEAKALVKSMRAQVERLTQELASAKYEYQKAEFKLNSVNDIMQQRRFLVSGHDLEQNKAKALAEELEKANKQVASLLNELDEVKHENLKLQRSYSRLEAEAQARRQRDEKAESERQAEESSISKKYQEQMRELRALVQKCLAKHQQLKNMLLCSLCEQKPTKPIRLQQCGHLFCLRCRKGYSPHCMVCGEEASGKYFEDKQNGQFFTGLSILESKLIYIKDDVSLGFI